jgi:hypothetical protein
MPTQLEEPAFDRVPDVADMWGVYGDWLEDQDRMDEAAEARRKAEFWLWCPYEPFRKDENRHRGELWWWDSSKTTFKYSLLRELFSQLPKDDEGDGPENFTVLCWFSRIAAYIALYTAWAKTKKEEGEE